MSNKKVLYGKMLQAGDVIRPVDFRKKHNINHSYYARINEAIVISVDGRGVNVRITNYDGNANVAGSIAHLIRSINYEIISGPSLSCDPSIVYESSIKIYKLRKGSLFYLHNGYFVSQCDTVYIQQTPTTELDFSICKQ